MVTIAPPAPRLVNVASGRRTRGNRVVDRMRQIGFEPHAWQVLLSDLFLQEGSNGRLHYRNCGALVSRQSGKTAWAAARVAQQCLDYPRQHVAFTSQDRINAVRSWQEHVDLIVDSPLGSEVQWLVRGSGRECLTFANGSWYRPVTPNRYGARGLSLDLAIVDEALTHSQALLAALGPTLAARPGSQFVTISNAGTEDSVLLQAMREQALTALDDPNSKRAWCEWSADPTVPGFSTYDEDVWHAVMPTLGQPNGVDLDFVRSMAQVMDEVDFRREFLCVPSTASDAIVIPAEVWRALYRTDVVIGDSVALGIDMTPERDAAALVAAGKVGDYIACEVVQCEESTDWLLARTVEVAQRWQAPVVVDNGASVASLVPLLEAAEVEVILTTGRQYARACGYFYDRALDGHLTHLDQWQLNDAVGAAVKRPLGDAWAWNRRGGVNLTPLVAATLAAWVAGTRPMLTPQVH